MNAIDSPKDYSSPCARGMETPHAPSLSTVQRQLSRAAQTNTQLAMPLKQLADGLTHVQRIRTDITAVDSALGLTLALLATADAVPVRGDQLHCLLAPLAKNLSSALARLDNVL